VIEGKAVTRTRCTRFLPFILASERTRQRRHQRSLRLVRMSNSDYRGDYRERERDNSFRGRDSREAGWSGGRPEPSREREYDRDGRRDTRLDDSRRRYDHAALDRPLGALYDARGPPSRIYDSRQPPPSRRRDDRGFDRRYPAPYDTRDVRPTGKACISCYLCSAYAHTLISQVQTSQEGQEVGALVGPAVRHDRLRMGARLLMQREKQGDVQDLHLQLHLDGQGLLAGGSLRLNHF
jgi:hypothetical protein